MSAHVKAEWLWQCGCTGCACATCASCICDVCIMHLLAVVAACLQHQKGRSKGPGKEALQGAQRLLMVLLRLLRVKGTLLSCSLVKPLTANNKWNTAAESNLGDRMRAAHINSTKRPLLPPRQVEWLMLI